MAPFVKTPEFAKLNVGFALDEGLPSANDEMLLMYGERAICRKEKTTIFLLHKHCKLFKCTCIMEICTLQK